MSRSVENPHDLARFREISQDCCMISEDIGRHERTLKTECQGHFKGMPLKKETTICTWSVMLRLFASLRSQDQFNASQKSSCFHGHYHTQHSLLCWVDLHNFCMDYILIASPIVACNELSGRIWHGCKAVWCYVYFLRLLIIVYLDIIALNKNWGKNNGW